MALLKAIELDSGIVLNYHRIVTITKVTNKRTILEIAGYTSSAKREQEMQQLANGETITVYIDTTRIGVDYDEEATIKDWYAYLKTTEKYSGAEDDEEEVSAQTEETTTEDEISSEAEAIAE